MAKAITLYDTTIGKKVVLALTGLVLYGFVIVHMLGNLQVFMGPEQLNGYAKKLHDLGPLLWVGRIVILSCFVVHVATVLQLYARTQAARPIGYRLKKNQVTTYAALTMKFGGIALFLFVLYHLAHLTVPGVSMAASYKHDAIDVYANVVNGFRVPWVTAIYVVAQVFLGMHLYHGAFSLFQSLGLNHPRYTETLKFLAQTLGVAVAAANIAMPVAVLAGVVK
ncbi:MAG: succinate dehydrogenase cytochrome b subunit [Polyangiaceae bacterium]